MKFLVRLISHEGFGEVYETQWTFEELFFQITTRNGKDYENESIEIRGLILDEVPRDYEKEIADLEEQLEEVEAERQDLDSEIQELKEKLCDIYNLADEIKDMADY